MAGIEVSVLDSLVNGTGNLLEAMIEMIINVFNSFLPLFIFMFGLALLYATILLFDIRRYFKRGALNGKRR